MLENHIEFKQGSPKIVTTEIRLGPCRQLVRELAGATYDQPSRVGTAPWGE